jgi:HEAT repeat protein
MVNKIKFMWYVHVLNHSADIDKKCIAAGKLGEMKIYEAVKPLIDAILDENPVLSKSAEDALLKLGKTAIDYLEEKLEQFQDRPSFEFTKVVINPKIFSDSALVLMKLGKVDMVIPFLKNKDRSVELAAEGLIRKYRSESIVPLIQALDTKGNPTKKIIELLEQLGDERAVDPLIRLLESNSEDLHETVVHALGKLKNRRAVEPLLKLFDKCRKDNLRTYIIWALRDIGDSRAVSPLFDLLQKKTTTKDVRRTLEIALAMLGDQRMFCRMMELFKGGYDVSPSDQSWAAAGLGAIGNTEAVETLINALESSFRITSAESLGKLKDKRAVKPLIKLLNDLKNQKMLAENLYNKASVEANDTSLSDRQRKDAMHVIFNDPRFQVKSTIKAVINALGEIGDPQAVEAISQFNKDKDEEVRQCAISALKKLNGK